APLAPQAPPVGTGSVLLASSSPQPCSGKEPQLVARKMHADEIDTDVALVRRLLAAQFPEWATLPIEPVRSAGTDNALYRLGQDMVVRLPRHLPTVRTLKKERRWLPKLAP